MRNPNPERRRNFHFFVSILLVVFGIFEYTKALKFEQGEPITLSYLTSTFYNLGGSLGVLLGHIALALFLAGVAYLGYQLRKKM